MVWAYTKGKLRDGFPRLIGAEFKGVPADLDAAVECHPGECAAETVLFFKGEGTYLTGEGNRLCFGDGAKTQDFLASLLDSLPLFQAPKCLPMTWKRGF